MILSLITWNALAAAVVGQGDPAAGRDWPSFLGPRGDNSSAEVGLAREWPAEGPPIQWATAVGPGYGGAAVGQGEVFLLDRVASEADRLRCFSFEEGRELWSYTYEAPGRLSYPGSRGVPTITEDRVYTIGAFGHVYCFDRETGQPVWAIDQADSFDVEPPYFGWCQSPLLFEDLLILAPLGEDVGLAALDRHDGSVRWTSPGLGQSHSTPTLVDLNGRPQVLMVTARVTNEQRGQDQTPEQSAEAARAGAGGLITSLDPADGEILWHSFAPACTSPVAPAAIVGEGLVLVSGGYRAGTVLLAVEEEEGDFTVRELSRNPRGAQVHPAVRWGEHLFLLVNENWNETRSRLGEGGLMCMGFDGRELWRTGADPYFGRGPMIVADGVLIIQDGRTGTLRLVAATSEGYRQLASAEVFPVPEGGVPRGRGGRQMWAPMALADGRLLLRSQSELRCVDLRPQD